MEVVDEQGQVAVTLASMRHSRFEARAFRRQLTLMR